MTPHSAHMMTPIPPPQPVPGALDAIAQRGRPDRPELVAFGEVFDGDYRIRHDLFTTESTESIKSQEQGTREAACKALQASRLNRFDIRIIDDFTVGGYQDEIVAPRRGNDDLIRRITMKFTRQMTGIPSNTISQLNKLYTA